MKRSMDLFNSGKTEKAFDILDNFLAEAIEQKRDTWIRIASSQAAVMADVIGDVRRVIHYKEQSLPYVSDYSFALHNLAKLLLSDGQVDLAKEYAAKAYEFSIARGTEADRDLARNIAKQWPELDRGDN